MKKFEYMKIRTMPGDLVMLNTLGSEGWEMCACEENTPIGRVVYMKRELEESEKKDA